MSYYITSPIYRTHSFSIFSLPDTLVVLVMVRTATRTTTAVILLRSAQNFYKWGLIL